MSCHYHEFVSEIMGDIIMDIMENFEYLNFYIVADSFYADRYINKFQTILNIILTDEQRIIVRKNGDQLENVIEKWGRKNPQISQTCVLVKIYEYMIKQFKQPELLNIIGNCICNTVPAEIV
jgi:hypothetical protein